MRTVPLPAPRGELSSRLLDAVRRPPDRAIARHDPDSADDAQLSLWLTQQLAYRRVDGVDPAWEDHPDLHAIRHGLERSVEAELRARVAVPSITPQELPAALVDLIASATGPSLSSWMARHGQLEHLREFVVHRAAYQLQEADPHSFAIPRLAAGRCKAALLELQLDEYGGFEPTASHASLFARTMRALDLEPVPSIDLLPAETLATNTFLNLLGRSRRLVGALVGHLAVFEMTSVEPMGRYAATVRRLVPEPAASDAARFYDIHVEADAVHERIALSRLVGGFAQEHPDEVGEVLFGAAALMHVEGVFARRLLDRWWQGATSLRSPLPPAAAGTGRGALLRLAG